MDSILARLFAESDDFRLIDALAVAVPEYSDAMLPRPQQVVQSVWHASGVIGNGGLWAFFRADFDTFAVIESLEEICAHNSAAALKKGVSVFPDSRPHSDWMDRSDFINDLDQQQSELLSVATDDFHATRKELLSRLGTYVRSNADAFESLQAGWVARDYVEKLKPAPGVSAEPREIALWILGLGGHVKFPELDGEVQFFNSTYYPLPQNEISIIEIGLPSDRSDMPETMEQISKLTSIRDTLATINFERCDFSADVLPSLCKLPALQSMILSGTNVADSDLATFQKLKLIEIDLDHTAITDDGVKYLSELPTLQKVSLDGTQVTIDCVERLADLPLLEEVNLPTRILSDKTLGQLISLVSLKTLSLGNSEITDTSLSLVAGMTKLQSLDLESCSISDAGLVALANLPNLKTLGLRYTDISDAGIKYLECLKNLESLDLNSTKVTSASLSSIGKLSGLKVLELDSTKVTDDGIDHLISLPSLERLSLFETEVGDAAMKHVGKISTLVDLTLSDTRVTDTGIAELANLKSLRYLSFLDTNVTDMSIPTLSGFRQIRQMYTADSISAAGEKQLRKKLKHWQ